MSMSLVKNTLTNYLGMVVRFIQGVLVTRWMIADLGRAQYGLWGLLWSFFCYSLLLDFGLGLAAQKATAAELWKKDIQKYNRTIGAVVSINCLMSLLIVAGAFFGAFYVRELLHLEGEAAANPEYYQKCFMVCGIGSALVFPLGVFREILVGLHKIYFRNYIQIVSRVVELAMIITVFMCGGGLLSLLIATLSLMALTQLVMTVFAWRSIPGFRLQIVLDKEITHEIFHFSGWVYLVSLARLVWERGSTLMIAMFSGLNLVSDYNVGCRLSVLMSELTGAYQENVSPVSATLHAQGKKKELADLLLHSLRWNSFLATGLTLGMVIYTPVLLRFMYKVDSWNVNWISGVSIIAVWIWLVFRYVPEKYLLVAEQHRAVSWMGITESVLFVLSTVLILTLTDAQGAFTVMYTSIGSRFVATFVILFPVFLRHSGIPIGRILREAVCLPLLAGLPTALLGLAEYWFLSSRLNDFWLLMIAGCTCGPIYLAGSFLWVLRPEERSKIPFLSRRFPAKESA